MSGPFSLAARFTSQLFAPVRHVARAVADPAATLGRGRRVQAADGRAHIEVRGVHLPEAAEAGRRVERSVASLEGVMRAELNAPLGRVVVDYAEDQLDVKDLVGAVAELEREHGLAELPAAPASATHPGDPGQIYRQAVAAGAAAVGLGYVAATRLLPLRLLVQGVPAVLGHVDSNPRLRSQVERRLGQATADLLFGVGGAVAGALARRPVGLLVDSTTRLCLLAEAQAGHDAWARWDARLATVPGSQRSEPRPESGPRPGRLLRGPVERVADAVGSATVLGCGAVLAATRSVPRAQALLVAGVPKAAQVGRETFAAQLGRGIADRDVVVLDRAALRRLDRVDVVVVDADVLRTGGRVIRNVLPLDGADPGELAERGHQLVDLTDCELVRTHDGWAVEPTRSAALPAHARHLAEDLAEQGGTVLTLRRDDRAVGLVEVAEEVDPLAEPLIAAARRVGRVLLAGRGDGLEAVQVDDAVPGGVQLATSVRTLQDDGHGVLVVSARNGAGLAAADVGLGVGADRAAPPWGAQLVCTRGLGEACVLLAAVPDARLTSRRSAQLALVGCASGALLGVLGPATGSAARAAVPVNLASLAAVGAGSWWGSTAARRPAPSTAPTTPWHAMPAATVLQRLDSTVDGLSDGDAEQRALDADGERPAATDGLVRASAEELSGPLTATLAVGAGISAVVGAVADALLITGVLGANALIGGAQRVQAHRELRSLLEAIANPVRLRRGGRTVEIPAAGLVAGDVIELDAGEAVPADCRLLEADALEVDESSLTGESQLVDKSTAITPSTGVSDRRCMLYRGTAVAAGRAVGVVVGTGTATEVGHAMAAVDAEGQVPAGGVEARLQSLTKVTLPVSAGAGVALLARDLAAGQPLGPALGRGVSLAVAAVPEGLPFVATVAELAAARRLSARATVVSNAATIEALGRADVLCFDKTGTLTEGRIALRAVSDGASTAPAADLTPDLRAVLGAALRASPDNGNGRRVLRPTDRAVIEGAAALGVGPDEAVGPWRRIDELPFTSSRGYHVTLGRDTDRNRVSVKGAPEVVLGVCRSWRRPQGEADLDAAARTAVATEVDRLARRGYRVLAVAEGAAPDRAQLDEISAGGLRLLGLLAFADPVRPTAAQSVRTLQGAGVDVVMVTGDHPSTAEAIAAELDALNGRRVMTGAQLDAIDDETLGPELPGIAVFARVTPAQKARIVRVLKANGRVVAVTGDGANDAPAIRLADVGIALGERATPAAREAADVVVTDDRIETVTDAIVEGRAMWASVRDAVAMLLGGNLGELGFTLGAGLVSSGDTLNARQLLLVNLLTDVLPAMAVAVRPPPGITPEVLLAEGPEASLGDALIRDVRMRGAVTAGSAAVAWLLTLATGPRAQASTAALVALVGAQLGQTLVMRQRSRLVVLSGVGSLALLAAIVQTPGVSHFFGNRPLWPHTWLIAGGSALVGTAVSAAAQALRRS